MLPVLDSRTFESRISNRSSKYCVLPASSAAISMAPNGIATPVGALNVNGEECDSLESFSSFTKTQIWTRATETAKSRVFSESFAKDNGSFAYDVSAAIEIAGMDGVEGSDAAGSSEDFDEAPSEIGASGASIFTSPVLIVATRSYLQKNESFPSMRHPLLLLTEPPIAWPVTPSATNEVKRAIEQQFP